MTISDFYSQEARKLDAELGLPYANWFHFAAWGTHSVEKVIASDPDSRFSAVLARAEERIYDSVRNRDAAVDAALRVYEIASVQTECAQTLMYTGTFLIAEYEQKLIDPDLSDAFCHVPMPAAEITKYLFVDMPGVRFHLSDDVPGFPGTAAKDWRRLNDRLRWISAITQARQSDPRLRTELPC